ncbi:FtsX-like permease family protein [Lysobacter sp. F60174L2]|uniref:FtsX-like permease family protein n=1 Tax=Lysobacter sp. F60174L2 TaxID=3459295 RepID=UPI00403DB6B2
MQIGLILAALQRHRLAALMIALEIALACAVLCNACFLIAERMQAMRIDTGVDEAALAVVRLDGYDESRATDLNARMLAGLAALPGVQSASAINAVPFGPRAGTAGIKLDPEGKHFGGVVDFYVGGPGSLEALDVRIVAGRAPEAGDYQPMAGFLPSDASVLVTRALAEHLWPGADPLGREFWMSDWHYRVVGVIDHLAIPAPGSRGPASTEWSVFVPARPGPGLTGNYLLRGEPGRMAAIIDDARTLATRIAPDAVLVDEESRTLGELRARYFEQDRDMTGLLVGVVVALLLVTALGIVGLASFWVAQRRKQIGIRRALGATRGDILRYFQTENFLIVTFGVVLGMVLAYAINLGLMQRYELPRLPAMYLPVGAVTLWLLGQLAVLGPARRAASVPPAVATRSV